MKYNIGDKVVDINFIELLFNPYWKTDYRETVIKTVKDANENYFTITESIEYGCKCGANEYVLYSQLNGKQIYGNKIFLHKEKDKEEIIKIINDTSERNFTKEDDNLKHKIENALYEREKLKETYKSDLDIAMSICV